MILPNNNNGNDNDNNNPMIMTNNMYFIYTSINDDTN